MSVVVVYL